MNLKIKMVPILALFVWLTTLPLSSFAADGLIMVVGDVLPLKNQIVWRNLVRLSERREGEHLVIAAAHDRPKLYGGFTLRAFQRYGKVADLIPLAEEFQEFATDQRYLKKDEATAERVQGASSVFFVGGKPERLSKVLFDRRGRPTALSNAIQEAYDGGSLIVGGVPGRVVVSTQADPFHALQAGELEDEDFANGLGLLEHEWFIDQHYFGRGRFATSLVAMHQFGMQYGIGVGLDTAAVVHGNSVEVLGNRGVVIVDLSEASFEDARRGLKIENVRLSYLESGDRTEIGSKKVTPYSSKKNGFEITPNWEASPDVKVISSKEVFRSGELVRLMYEAVDSKDGQAIGYALHHDDDDEGFEFRFFTRKDSRGWLSVEDDQERVTLENVYLDVNPI